MECHIEPQKYCYNMNQYLVWSDGLAASTYFFFFSPRGWLGRECAQVVQGAEPSRSLRAPPEDLNDTTRVPEGRLLPQHV